MLQLMGGGGYTFFDGMLFQDACITDVRKLSPILDKAAIDHSDVFGRYIYGTFSDAGQNHIHRDVLGFEPLFVGFNEEVSVISNFPNLAAQGLFGDNYRKNKNLMALAQVTLASAVNDLTTSFQNVFWLPQNAGILIDGENHVFCYSMINHMYYNMSEEERNKQLDKTLEQCQKLFRKASITGGNITGGYDSRISLAIAISCDILRDIKFTVQGTTDHPDVLVAKQIAASYNLNLEHQSASVSNVAVPMQNIFDKAMERQYRQAGMRSFSEDLANATSYWAYQAHKSDDNRVKANCKPNANFKMTLNGVANEEFRGYKSLQLQNEGIVNHIISDKDREILISKTVDKNALSVNAYEYIHEKLDGYFQSFEDLYSLDLLTCQTRLPQFHGGLNYRDSFSIGMHPWLHRLAMMDAPEFRAAQRIAFQIIGTMEPELLYFPFAGKAWPAIVYAGRKDRKRLRNIVPVENMSQQPLPSNTSLGEKARFIFDKGIELHDEIWKVYNAGFLENLNVQAQDIISGQMPINNRVLFKLLDIYGNSMFMDNMEKPLVQKSMAQPLCDKELDVTGVLYEPNLYFLDNARDVVLHSELLFQKKKVFAHKDHDNISIMKKLFMEISR